MLINNMEKYIKINKNEGFSLIETIFAIFIFIAIATAVYTGFVGIQKVMNVIRVKGIMTNLANEQFEISRNLSYQDVGTISGIPAGVLSQNKTVSRDNKNFNIETTVRSVDDPFDGTFNGTPRDLSPGDMKIVELTITCTSCGASMSSVSFTTKIAPKNLETASTNGALVIRVFDASGLPVSDAEVNIINNNVNPKINLTDNTDINGTLTIVDAPPSSNGYQIIVTKTGYSTDRTYPVAGPENPHPTKPNVTVVIQQVTQISFTIDKTSTINFSTVNNQCTPTSGFDFNMIGSKLIGTIPNTYKYSNSLITNNNGELSLTGIEWDTYTLSGIDSLYDIIGTSPLLSLGINPNVVQNMEIVTAPKNGNRLLVVVRDQSTGLPITDAVVTLTGPSNYSKTLTTNEGFLTQTDWSDGNGQEAFGAYNKFLIQDGNIDTTKSTGNLSLKKVSSNYLPSGNITSSTFDTGSSSHFRQIIWSSIVQPPQTGTLSVKIQIATNNDNSTWNFVGPNDTSSTYFTSTNQNINSSHDGDRYFRYRLYLSTENTLFTPTISDVSFTYTSSCIPPGQVSFSSLSTGNYTVSISKTGYQNTSKTVSISSSWTKQEMTISP